MHWFNWLRLRLPTPERSNGLNGRVRMIAFSLSSLLLTWTPLQAAPLPCLDSGNDCLRTLTDAAIERSPELQTLDERIDLIDRRLQLAGQRIDQANANGQARDLRGNNIPIDRRAQALRPYSNGFCPQCRGELRSPKRYIIKAQVPKPTFPEIQRLGVATNFQVFLLGLRLRIE